MRLSQKSGLVLGVVAAATALAGLAAAVFGQGGNYGLPSEAKRAPCGSSGSYYFESELYRAERNVFSAKAKAYQIIASDGRELRAVLDGAFLPTAGAGGAKDAELLLVLSDSAKTPRPLNSLFIERDINASREVFYRQRGLLSLSSPLIVSFEFDAAFGGAMDAIEGEIILRSSKGCLAVIDFDLSLNLTAEIGDAGIIRTKALKGGELGEVLLSPGLNPIGFSDWRYFGLARNKGASILALEKGRWHPQSPERFLAEPGVGYFLVNTDKRSIELPSPRFFRVPEEISVRSVKPGWNLLYNDLGQAATGEEITASVLPDDGKRRSFLSGNEVSLSELAVGKFASGDIYLVEMEGELRKMSLGGRSGEVQIPEGAVFWFYLFGIPVGQELVLPEFALEPVKETVKARPGEDVSLKFKLKNLSSASRFVSSPQENDFCQFGVRVTDEGGRVLLDDKSASAACPLFPLPVELKPGGTLELNRVWQIPALVKGNLSVKGYFDYTRLDSYDMIVGEMEVEV